ncbi:hypothetical protein HPP92_008002 [Vanilla planifolia]|uniref:Cytochrome P450 n=1 Tax=Vanilla planifolia TaxID=51239 RepID=A0A835V882_VANPL|nr:hypothetical protein HPP92_008002 [Vanilla planifolia]
MAREVLKLHDLDFCSRPQLVCTSKYSYDNKDLAVAPYGDYWRKMRKICIVELFSTARIASFQSIREEEVSLLIESISSSLLVPVNLTEIVNSLTMNIICRVAFSKKNKPGDHKSSEFFRLFKEMQALLGSFFVADFFPLMGWVDKLTGLRARLERNFRELDAFYEEVIDEHIDPKRVRTQQDIVDVLLHVQDTSPNLTRAHIKAVLMDILIAGTETSSATITWAMAELARNPSIMRRAQEEVRNAVGRSKECVKEGDLHRLRYVKSVVKETLRLHSPDPLLLLRESMRTCEVGGNQIEPKTRFYVNAWGIARDPKTWEKPEEFWPERFMDSSIDVLGQSFELIPFGSGRRVCPGLSLGMTTVELALANLLHCFDWKLPNGIRTEELDMDDAPGITVHKKTPLYLVASV